MGYKRNGGTQASRSLMIKGRNEMNIQNIHRAATPAFIGLAALLSLGASQPAHAQIQVEVNREPVEFMGAQPEQIRGRVFIPLRDVAEALDAEVRWDPATQSVFGSRGRRLFKLPIGKRNAIINGERVRLDAPAQVVNGTTIVPLRFVAEALGAEVTWRPARQLVAINLPERGQGGDRRNPDRRKEYRPQHAE